MSAQTMPHPPACCMPPPLPPLGPVAVAEPGAVLLFAAAGLLAIVLHRIAQVRR